jgi:hypothetical protein
MQTENNNLPPTFDPSELKMPGGEAASALRHEEKKIGLIIILLVIALGLILVGLFLWYKAAFSPAIVAPLTEERFVPEMPNEPEMPNAEAEIQRLETVSTSNDTAAIEADLLSTDLSTLDSEMLSIENEINAAVTE